MTVKYAVTFEFDNRAPLTYRGVVEGWTASTCTRRAVPEAQKALGPVNWSSMVCVLLERVPAKTGDATEDRRPREQAADGA